MVKAWKEALQCFRHTQRLSHTWILRKAHREREGSRSKIQTQRDRETSTHTGRDMHSSDLHTPRVWKTETPTERKANGDLERHQYTQKRNLHKESEEAVWACSSCTLSFFISDRQRGREDILNEFAWNSVSSSNSILKHRHEDSETEGAGLGNLYNWSLPSATNGHVLLEISIVRLVTVAALLVFSSATRLLL